MADRDTAPSNGKAMLEAAEDAYDTLADKYGIDEHGDDIPEIDDDEPAIDDDEAVVAEVEDEDEEEEFETEEAEAGEEETGAEHAEPVTESLDAPHTWKPEWKDAYNKIEDPVVRRAIHELTGHMNKAFSERMTEFAQAKRDNQGIQQAVTPHVNRLQRAGITPEVAVSRALGWDQYMQADPVQGWLDDGKAIGIDPSQVLKEQQQENMDQYLTPSERALKEQNSELAARIQAQEQNYARWEKNNQETDWTQRQAKAASMLHGFMNAKDDAGHQLHPHVEMVAPMMTRLIQNGVTTELEEAYQMAAANNPDLRKARDNTRKARQVKASQLKAKKVRKASESGIVGKGSTRGQPKAARSTAAQVDAAYDKIANA